MQKFQSRKSLLRCPSPRDLDVRRLLPRFEAPGRRRPWRPPRRLSRATAPQPRRGRRSPRGAAAFRLRRFFLREPVGAAVGFRRRRRGTEAEAPWEDDESSGDAELYTRSTDKGMTNVLDFKTVQGKKNIHKIHLQTFKASFLQNYFDETMCNSFSIKNNVISGTSS